jgi:hypothetical protein
MADDGPFTNVGRTMHISTRLDPCGFGYEDRPIAEIGSGAYNVASVLLP